MLLPDIIRYAARKYPDDPALYYEDVVVTFSDLLSRAAPPGQRPARHRRRPAIAWPCCRRTGPSTSTCTTASPPPRWVSPSSTTGSIRRSWSRSSTTAGLGPDHRGQVPGHDDNGRGRLAGRRDGHRHGWRRAGGNGRLRRVPRLGGRHRATRRRRWRTTWPGSSTPAAPRACRRERCSATATSSCRPRTPPRYGTGGRDEVTLFPWPLCHVAGYVFPICHLHGTPWSC